jgi:hypothetical protein
MIMVEIRTIEDRITLGAGASTYRTTEYVRKADYDAVAAELAAMTSDRDYHRASAIQQSVYWRTHHEARIKALEAALQEMFKAEDAYGCGFYGQSNWLDPYNRLREMVTPSETPVSTLCAVCDQIKELHPSTHPWTPKTTAKETPAEQGCNYCGAIETNPDCPECQGIER